MTLFDLLAASTRPILYEISLPGARYSLGGTAMVCSLEQEWYIVTADHCLDFLVSYPEEIGKQASDAVCIQTSADSREFFRYDTVTRKRRLSKKQPHSSDISVMQIRKPAISMTELAKVGYIPLDNTPDDPFVGSCTHKMLLRGYPLSAKNEIRYSDLDEDAGIISRQSLTISGQYIGQDPQAEGCHLFAFDRYEEVPERDVNGMSGGSVFAVSGSGGGMNVEFAGLFIGYQKYLGKGIFVDRSLVKAKVRDVLRQPGRVN